MKVSRYRPSNVVQLFDGHFKYTGFPPGHVLPFDLVLDEYGAKRLLQCSSLTQLVLRARPCAQATGHMFFFGKKDIIKVGLYVDMRKIRGGFRKK